MIKIYKADQSDDLNNLRELFIAYFDWASKQAKEFLGFSFDPEQSARDSISSINQFYPPKGRVFLASWDTAVAGVACLKALGSDIGELKRMFVQPAFRRRGIARSLLSTIIDEARSMGFKRLRLDSARFMDDAHLLYRSVGFEEIEAYNESEIPSDLRKFWIFMEKDLK